MTEGMGRVASETGSPGCHIDMRRYASWFYDFVQAESHRVICRVPSCLA
jgi:hypothetical protein